MKTFFALLFSLLLVASAEAQKITAKVTVTNITVNGNTFTVNGNVRTFTNVVFQSGSQILTNADVFGGGSKTNLYNQIALNPYSQVVPLNISSNSFALVGAANVALVVTASGTWASVSYSTQAVSSAVSVRVPVTIESAAEQTNIASGIVQAINLSANTNAIDPKSVAASQLLGNTNAQTVTGQKIFNNTSNTWTGASISASNINGGMGSVSNGTWTGGNIVGGTISGLPTIALSNNAASQTIPFFSHYDTLGNDSFIITHGGNEFFLGITNIVTGQKSSIDGNIGGEIEYNITDAPGQLGSLFHRFYITATNSIAFKFAEIGTNGLWASRYAGVADLLSNLPAGQLIGTVPTAALAGTTLSNVTHVAQTTFSQGGDIAFARFAITSLANGNNAALPIGTNYFIEVSGPSAAFTINGIANGRDGKKIEILNQTGFQMTIANESGTDPTAANRIRTLGSATDLVLTNAIVKLIYSGNNSRWLVESHNP